MAGLRDLLSYGMQRGNAARRNLRSLMQQPSETLNLWGTQTAEDMTTPQQRSTLHGLTQFNARDPELQKKMLDLALQALTVYHGSPHKFAPEPGKPLGSFRSDKIGTGEGAQAFGHGLYLAERPGVARSYADQLGVKTPIGKDMVARTNVEDWADNIVQGADDKVHAETLFNELAANFRPGEVPKGFKDIGSFKKAVMKKVNELWSGHLYKVDLPDEQIAKMLDWDKPLSQQPGMLSTARAAMHKGPQEALRMDVWVRDNPNATGGDLIKQIERLYGIRYANEALGKAGIPGIKYLDQGSRTAGEGTRNFVVFPGNEGILKILERQ